MWSVRVMALAPAVILLRLLRGLLSLALMSCCCGLVQPIPLEQTTGHQLLHHPGLLAVLLAPQLVSTTLTCCCVITPLLLLEQPVQRQAQQPPPHGGRHRWWPSRYLLWHPRPASWRSAEVVNYGHR